MVEVIKRKQMREIESCVIVCPHCGRKIKGKTEKHVRYNYKLHAEAKHGVRVDEE